MVEKSHHNDATTVEGAEERRDAAPPPSPKPPHGPRISLIALVTVAVLIALVVGAWLSGPIGRGYQGATEFIKTRFSEETPAADRHEHEQDGGAFYTCGMHPWVILPKSGLCPICHMDLTPIDPDKFTGEITIDPVVTQNIGVRIAPVEKGPVVQTIRTVGTVGYDETRVRDVNTKIGGWIENLYVDYLGAAVEKGDPLFDIYSPELYQAQEEYLIALRRQAETGEPSNGIDLLESARTRLEYFDITDDQIEMLRDTGEPTKTLTIQSPHTGVVIAKHANEGMKIDPGMQVFRIADLSKVWVMVKLYEYQLPFVSIGQEAAMSLPYIPGQTFEGRVIYIYPYLDEKTRQVNVRLEFENPNGTLKPGMYATIRLQSTLAKDRTLAPTSAVINTGERQVAFVSHGEGRFEPRNVTLGAETENGMVQILDGLKPGEMVVTSGLFLLDSESKMRESLAKMIRGEMAADQKVAVEVQGASELADLPGPVQEELNRALDAYFAIGEALASDTTEGIDEPAQTIASSIGRLLEMELPQAPNFWGRHEEVAVIRGRALELPAAETLEDARLIYADMSVAMSKLLRATGVPPTYDDDVMQAHCPMYRDGQGGSVWLQPAGPVRNPFYGSVMLECFDERFGLPVTGAAPDEDAAEEVEEEPAADDEPAPSISLTPAVIDAIDRIVRDYLEVQTALASDETAGVDQRLRSIAESASELGDDADGGLADVASQVADAAQVENGGIDSVRADFHGLSEAVIALVKLAPPSSDATAALHEAYCPMAKGAWLQAEDEVRNPYYGSEMLTCGSIRETIVLRASEED